MLSKKILFITGSRSEYDLIKNVSFSLSKEKYFECHMLITGSHLSNKYGKSINLITKNNNIKRSYVDINVRSSKIGDISNSLSLSINKFNSLFKKIKPNQIVIVGDRYESYAAAIVAKINNIEIIHSHGGETTSGAYDDYWRHSITIMADIHFVANKKYFRRVAQLKNSKKNIYIVGGLGIDNILKSKFLKKDTLQRKYKFRFNKNNIIVVYHSETKSPSKNRNNFKKIIDSFNNIKGTNFFISYPGHDVGSDEIVDEINKLKKKNYKNFFIFKNLGEIGFLSLLKICDCIIGNSSSGIIEAPYLKTNTINLGLRQNGRLKDISIIDCPFDKNKIEKKIMLILNLNKKKRAFGSKKHYGSGNASQKALRIIKNAI